MPLPEALVAAALLGAFVLRTGWLDALPVLCWSRRLADVPCPGCGLTHAWVATAHGDFAAAFDAHFFGPLLFTAAVLWLLSRCTTRGRALLQRVQTSALSSRVTLWSLACAWLGYSVGRVVL